VVCHPQRRISRPGDLLASSLKCPVLIFMAAAILAGVAEINPHESMHAALAPPPEERIIPQEPPARPAATVSMSTTDRLGNHDLMLVNTAIPNQMDAPKIVQFDRSPYDGLAVSFADAYDTSPVLSLAPMEAQIGSWKKSTTKEIWP
jgi:hypothetical protein